MKILSVIGSWFSRGVMLKRVYGLKLEVESFLRKKGNVDLSFVITTGYVTAFCIDITQHYNELDVNLQGANRLISEVFDKITAFEKKLRL
jgi:hypothetical protein